MIQHNDNQYLYLLYESFSRVYFFIFTAATTAVCVEHAQQINRVVKAAIINILMLTLGQTNMCECERSRS